MFKQGLIGLAFAATCVVGLGAGASEANAQSYGCRPVYHPSVHHRPVYHAPVCHAPVYHQPVYHAPAYHRPSYGYGYGYSQQSYYCSNHTVYRSYNHGSYHRPTPYYPRSRGVSVNVRW